MTQRVAVRPAHPTYGGVAMYLSVVVAGQDVTGDPPFQYVAVPIAIPYSVGTISGRTLTLDPEPEDGARVSVMWDTTYPDHTSYGEGDPEYTMQDIDIPFVLPYGRANMAYNATSGELDDVTDETQGDLWVGAGGTVANPPSNKFRVYVRPVVSDLLLWTIVPREYLIGVPIMAVMRRTTRILPDGTGHTIRRYTAFGIHTDMRWEFDQYAEIFGA